MHEVPGRALCMGGGSIHGTVVYYPKANSLLACVHPPLTPQKSGRGPPLGGQSSLLLELYGIPSL